MAQPRSNAVNPSSCPSGSAGAQPLGHEGWALAASLAVDACQHPPRLQVSVLAMTSSEEGSRETLKYKLQGAPGDVAKWGHEYIRHLAGKQAHWGCPLWVGVGAVGWRR